jgi:hypothetical protein
MQFQLETYASKVHALSVVWFLFAGLSLIGGFMGLDFIKHFAFNHFGHWGHGVWTDSDGPPEWLGHLIFHVAWVMVVLRSALLFLVGWGLRDRSSWGRVLAIVAAVLALFHFPIGTALGIWTLVVLIGYRNSTLYAQLGWNPQTGAAR